MPDLGVFDTALACEVLNYVEDPQKVVSNIHRSLKPGGTLLMSVEARWGWPMARDVAPHTLQAFFDTGIVHVPHDRWIRTYTEQSIRELLKTLTSCLSNALTTHCLVHLNGRWEM